MDLSVVYIIWLREMTRFFRDKSQILIGSVRPLTWLFFMGYGLSPYFQGHGTAYAPFVLPGIVVMAVLFTAIQSAIGIIWDREFGFLKEMLVAPIPRTSIVLGKAAGGTTLAIIEGGIVLLLAPVLGVRLSAGVILLSLLLMGAIGFALSTLGISIASRMRSFEGFGAIMNFLVMPLFLLSGALFPVTRLPAWLAALVHINPLTYGVDLLRAVILGQHQFPVALSVGVLVLFSSVTTATAVAQFNRQDS